MTSNAEKKRDGEKVPELAAQRELAATHDHINDRRESKAR
jgi:hypothetical protein